MVNLLKKISLKQKPLTGFTIFIILVCILNFLLNNLNHRFWLSDFRVYYEASKALLSGGQVYLTAFGESSGIYKYAPAVLYFFLPYTLFNFEIAKIIHFAVLSYVFWQTFIIIRRILISYFFPKNMKYESLLLSLSLIFIMIHLVRELHLGNINVVLLLLCCIIIESVLTGKIKTAGALLAIVILTKPFYLILLLPLIFRKQWKVLAITTGAVIVGLLLPFIFPGPVKAISLYHDWIKTILIHDKGFPGMNDLGYILRHFISPVLPWFIDYVLIAIAAIAVIWFINLNLKFEKKSGDRVELLQQNFIFEWFLLIAVIPDIVKTDSEHFLAIAPLVAFIIYYIASRRLWGLIPVMCLLFFFFGANSTDLLGRSLSDRLFSMGLLGISNLLIILVALILFLYMKNNRLVKKELEHACLPAGRDKTENNG